MSEDSKEDRDTTHYKYILTRCEDHTSERSQLLSAQLTVSERFDKWIIGLPAGAITLTIVFYEKIASKGSFLNVNLLLSCWIVLSIAVLIAFLNLYFSNVAFGKQIEICDAEHNDFIETSTEELPEGKIDNYNNKWNFWIHLSSWVSMILSVIGVVLFLMFAYCSTNFEKSMSNNDNKPMEKSAGHVPPRSKTPPPPPKRVIKESVTPQKSSPPRPPKK